MMNRRTRNPNALALTVAEALELVPLGRTAFYDAVRKGEIPSRRIGGKILIPRAELVRLFEDPTRPAA